MLTITQTLGQPLSIGGVVIWLRPKYGPGGKMNDNEIEVVIDAPREQKILRGDLILQDLESAGFYRITFDTWRRNGTDHTCRAAIALMLAERR